MTDADMPVVPKSSEEWREALRTYLKEHSGTRLIDLKRFTDPERGPLYIWAKRFLDRGELFEEPRTKALYFHGDVVPKKAPAEIVVRIIKDVPPFRDGKGEHRLRVEDVVTLQEGSARALIGRGVAVEVSSHEPMPFSVPTASPMATASEVSNNDEPVENEPSPTSPAKTERPHPDSVAGATGILEAVRRREEVPTSNLPTSGPESFLPNGGYAIEYAEPYFDGDEPAVAIIYNGKFPKFRTLLEWKEEDPILEKVLHDWFFPEKRPRWKYPSKPIIPSSTKEIGGEDGLHSAIMRCNARYIEFSDPSWASAFATWIIGSYLVPFLPRSPILPIFGPTGSGKGQVLDQLERLAYRGKKMIDPTPAVLYRLADRWKMTFGLDELQDKDKDSFREVLSIVKGSYDGTSVYRCDTNNEVEEFQTRSFFAISFKDRHPPEDVKNRGIQLTMQQNGTSKSLVPDDSPEHQELRARLMGLRIKALTDMAFTSDILKKVREISTPEALGFDRRPRDIAVSLLVPAVMSGQEKELIEIVKKSNAEALEANNSTFVARTHHTYEKLINNLESVSRYYPVLTIRAKLEETLKAEGELRDNQTLPTRRVTDALKTLGYVLVRRSGNDPFIDRDLDENKRAFETNRKKYAYTENEPDKNGPEAS